MDGDPYIEQPVTWMRRFVHFITFINQPLKRRFTLFFLGVLWWFVVMTSLSIGTLVVVRNSLSQETGIFQPMETVLHSVTTGLEKLQLCLSSFPEQGDPEALLARVSPAVDLLVSQLDRVVSISQDEYELRILHDQIHQIAETTNRLTEASATPSSAGEFQSSRTQLLVQVNDTIISARECIRLFSGKQQVRNDRILQVVTIAAMGSFGVLIVSTILLALFTYYIRKAIGQPIISLIRQVEALVEGNADLSTQIQVSSQDEIGMLSQKLNLLTEKLHSLSVFKQIIEEDHDVHAVYCRLGEVFQKLELNDFTLYEVEGNNSPRPVFPDKAINRHVDPQLQQEFGGKICRAIKANRMITSIEFPGICSRVCKNLDQDHACIPVMFSGGIFMIAQFVFDKIPLEKQASLNRRLQMATEFLDASRNVLETKQLLSELRESAIRDSLTELHNRRFLTEIMDSIIPAVIRRGEKLALAMCDIDHFKEINDQYGHDAGDIMLRAIAEIIKECGRSSDMIIRYGGEEFLVIFRDLDGQDPFQPAERIRQCCAENVVNYKGAVLSRTISLGVSLFPDDTADIWEAIHLADQALLQAKKSGRNRVVRYQHAKTTDPDERPH